MKKLLLFALFVIVIVIAGISISNKKDPVTADSTDKLNASSTKSVAVSETNKISSRTSKFQNSELGFSVNYPTSWEANSSDLGVTFIMPIDSNQVSTIAKLQAEISVSNTKCAFPPVTTVKDRGTINVGTNTLNMISMANTVQGRAYFNRMYSLQKDAVCYYFYLSTIALSPQSKNLTGSNLIQAENNNRAIIAAADAGFTEMVKSFSFITGPSGVDETKAAPAIKNVATSTATSTR